MNRITSYLPYVSKRAARRKPSAIRELMPLMKLPGMISLGGGLPNASLFPIDSLNVKLKV
jgi:kynurenine/2-aminoadipate aminotransferase